jgi:chromosome segregation ATPase
MPTQEERLFTVEQTQAKFGEAINDLNHHVTILTGIMQRQEWDIREIKSSLRAIDGHLGSFASRLSSLDGRLGTFDGRLSSLDSRLDSFELGVNGRFETLEGRLGSFEQSVNSRFETLESRFETQEKKLDQVLLLLNTLTSRPE